MVSVLSSGVLITYPVYMTNDATAVKIRMMSRNSVRP